MDAKNGEGENSSPLKETARIQFVHQRDIGIARARVRILRPSLALYAFHRRRQENTFLPSIHSRHWRLRTSISVWEKGLVTPFSFPPPLPLSSPSPIQRRLSLPPIQCNTLQSNPPLLFSPSHCCAGPVHDVILGNSTSLRFKEVA